MNRTPLFILLVRTVVRTMNTLIRPLVGHVSIVWLLFMIFAGLRETECTIHLHYSKFFCVLSFIHLPWSLIASLCAQVAQSAIANCTLL